MEYKVSKEHNIYFMDSKNKPVLTVPNNSTIVFETFDCFQEQITDEGQSIEKLCWETTNPATGPVYIEEAEKGDTLKVDILKIDVKDKGVMAAIPGAGLLGSEIKESQVKIVPIKDKKAIFNDKIHIPIAPMIGVIGVAPLDEQISCGAPDYHGGNMDSTIIREGATVYFPVNTKGALLAMGDLHACMGDGEIMVTGVEISGTVKVKVEVLKDKKIKNPMVEDNKYIYTIGSDEDLKEAVNIATKDMHKLVMDKLNMPFNEAGMLLSAVGDVEVCQVVDPKLTVRFKIPKDIIES
ncbi:acetamidase/formamidase family protein [Dethiothermospora halolimnae]|uniref:acetamidase/formamidase family protein n=1 Tax=Dethiothermospora halolimnae TaxID=3114390 RepID=UPI003CCB8EC0